MKTKIAFFEMKEGIELAQKHLSSFGSLRFFPDPLSLENASQVEDFEIISISIRSRIDKAIIEKLKNVKLLTTRSTGFDHIDIDEAQKHGIQVSSIPYYAENTVAEHTFALILALYRNIHRAYVRTIKGDFSLEGLQGFDLKNKTLGVIGVGHIGLHVIKIAKGFDMEILGYDIKKDHFLAEVLGFTYIDLDYLLANSDIISLHAPYNPQTHHMINKEKFMLMKKGALLINTARGGLIDTKALVWALDKEILGGAGLDVLEGEELIKDEMEALLKSSKKTLSTLVQSHILLHRENVVITPHIAFDSREAIQRILETSITNIKSFLQDKPENLIKAA